MRRTPAVASLLTQARTDSHRLDRVRLTAVLDRLESVVYQNACHFIRVKVVNRHAQVADRRSLASSRARSRHAARDEGRSWSDPHHDNRTLHRLGGHAEHTFVEGTVAAERHVAVRDERNGWPTGRLRDRTEDVPVNAAAAAVSRGLKLTFETIGVDKEEFRRPLRGARAATAELWTSHVDPHVLNTEFGQRPLEFVDVEVKNGHAKTDDACLATVGRRQGQILWAVADAKDSCLALPRLNGHAKNLLIERDGALDVGHRHRGAIQRAQLDRRWRTLRDHP